MKQYEQPYSNTARSVDEYNDANDDDDDDDDDNNNNNNAYTVISDSENVIDYQQLIFEKEGSNFA